MTGESARTSWGGHVDNLADTGFFRLATINGVHWLVDPDGGRFLSKGVNTVKFNQDTIQGTTRAPYAENCLRKYGSEEAWKRAAAQRLIGWGFNTLGSWSDLAVAVGTSLAVTPNLDLGMTFAWQMNDKHRDRPRQEFPDVYDPAFEAAIARRARDLCAPHADKANIIGWFIDNELRWCPDWRGPDELLPLFMKLIPGTPGRQAAITMLRERHGEFAAFNAVWRTPAQDWTELERLPVTESAYQRKPPYQRTDAEEDEADRIDPHRGAFFADCDAFLARLVERYFALTTAAIKAVDKNHLVLGARFAFPPPASVIEAAARHVDVISFNCYGPDADGALAAYAFTGKPCLLGEFSFRATDSGLPNTVGAGPVVATQAERAAAYQNYAAKALRDPSLVGIHWFEHADQPAEGRFDGENSNFGTVTIDDRPYEILTRTMTALNAEAEALHQPARLARGDAR